MKFSTCAAILSLGLFKSAYAACAGPKAQCGGLNFAGENCCQFGYECVKVSEWYSQCELSTPVAAPAKKYIAEDETELSETTTEPVELPEVTEVADLPEEPTTNTTYTPITARTENFFENGIYNNPLFIQEVTSSIPKLTPELQAVAEKVRDVPTAVWLAWEGAPAEVYKHLEAANGKTVVFILYMIPTRDCNSNASAGGASDLDKYKAIVNNIANTISQYPETNVAMVVEPDTLGNLVTGSTEACKNVHTLHKNALAYAADVFGSMDNVSVYLDAAHGMWLVDYADETADIIREILDKVPNGKIRGFSTNVSNYQPLYAEAEYHEKLNKALEARGITGMKFIVDTGRNGVDVYESFGKTKTWCNFVGTGLGERPKANPDPVNMPLLDAYMWLKTPGEADGSATGDRADPVCAREDSLPNAPDAGSWFHDYFAQLVENSNPKF